jgi:hypothetical protein
VILHTLNLGCSFITLRDIDVILHGFMLQIIFTTALTVLYYVCSIGIYYNVNGLKNETIRNGQKDVIVIL